MLINTVADQTQRNHQSAVESRITDDIENIVSKLKTYETYKFVDTSWHI